MKNKPRNNHATEEDDSQLKELLHSWDIEPKIPPDFDRAVWQRISSRQDDVRGLGKWLEFVGEQMARPRVAVSIALAVLTLTAFAAQIHSQLASHHTLQRLGERYAVTIDPLAPNHLKAVSR
tara:strand:- start:13998 stop:14363 length:366 start_codon:yes stop_codon:yes gene_type:complete